MNILIVPGLIQNLICTNLVDKHQEQIAKNG